MRRSFSTGIVIVASMVGLLSAWSRGGEKAADRDGKLLEGEWVVVAAEDEGVTVPDDDVKGNRWVFKGTEITAVCPDGATGRMSFRLDPGKKPKEIDVTSLDDPSKGKTEAGIYEVAEGRLRVCLRAKEKGRPTGFATTTGSGMTMMTFEKRKR
jgi:uncharacterized protein (TIGR03067 family)